MALAEEVVDQGGDVHEVVVFFVRVVSDVTLQTCLVVRRRRTDEGVIRKLEKRIVI